MRALVTKASYWAKCYEEFDAVSDDLTSKIDVETYWRKIGSMVNEDGNPKYSYLSKFALTVMLLPHGNADAERGFSINKKLLEKHGNNLHEETIESLRIVKDFLIQSGGQNNIDISTEMIKACKSSRENYYKYLAEKREQEKQQEARLDEEVCKFHTLIFILLKIKKSIISGYLVFYNQMCYQLFGYMPFSSSIFVDLFTERGIIWIFVDIQNKQKKREDERKDQ